MVAILMVCRSQAAFAPEHPTETNDADDQAVEAVNEK